MENLSRLPKGIWYEAPKRRFRVRRYHNKVVYGPYYFRTLEEAYSKWESLNHELSLIPKERKKYTRSTSEI